MKILWMLGNQGWGVVETFFCFFVFGGQYFRILSLPSSNSFLVFLPEQPFPHLALVWLTTVMSIHTPIPPMHTHLNEREGCDQVRPPAPSAKSMSQADAKGGG